ncbi:MAG: glycine--tRNA ligase subunit beta [Legionellaceae bacterium]|nr:glycine--tRNA ligase subunit beta [Legionellaceae bacterium]
MSKDFLLELGCEELPSAAVKSLSEAMRLAMVQSLEKAQLNFDRVEAYATPRRLALMITALADSQPAQQSQRRGPAVTQAFDEQGQPTRALLGFAKSCGVDCSALTRLQTDNGEWMVYEQHQEGRSSMALLPEIICDIMHKLPLVKPMRWGSREDEFARPVHWLVALYGESVLALELFGIQSDRYTRGHRFHANHSIALTQAGDYVPTLEKAFVRVDFAERQQQIVQQIETIAGQQQAQAIVPQSLLDEVTSIVEWPVAILAHFDETFLQVPQEALIAAMQEHQKCFALQDAQGKLLPAFITVANIASSSPERVRAGNEKVMRARLSDASFFFEQDKKIPLQAHIEGTRRVVFQEKLGSLYDKTERIQRLMLPLAQQLSLDPTEAEQAARLSKCDLLSGMVGEFPELQGVMGYYYALHHQESEALAQALGEQYLPRFAKDALPLSLMGKALSLVDRLDTLVGIFAIGQKPSGVKDPFKLRRHALAVVRLLASIPVPLSLQTWLDKSLAMYGNQLDSHKSQYPELHAFIIERLMSHYQGQGIAAEAIQAVLAVEKDCIVDIEKRLYALTQFMTRPEARVLAAACKRVDNILRQQEVDAAPVDETLFQEAAERQLWQQIQRLSPQHLAVGEAVDYAALLHHLAELKEPVDRFFDQVMVMVEAEALRANRLRLLLALQKRLQAVADISVLS